MSLARPRKLSHLDTIHYEIRMYRFCAERLSVMSTDAPDAGDRLSCYVFLEAFGLDPVQ